MDGTGVHVVVRALLVGLFLVPLSAPLSSVAAVNGCGADGGMPACQGGREPTSKAMSAPGYRHVGNPIDVVSGNKYQQVLDYQAFGSPLGFTRHYNSLSSDTNTGLGQGWRHTWQVSLTRLGTDRLEIVQGDGRVIGFARSDNGSSPGHARFDALTEGDGYIELDEPRGRASWYIDDGRRLSFRGSFLVRVDYDTGEHLEVQYRGNRVHQVRDSIGNVIELRYTPGAMALPRFGDSTVVVQPGHLESVRLPGGFMVRYRYQGRRNLVGVSYGEALIERYAYDDGSLGSHLTERIDTRGRTTTWTYDGLGRGQSYTHTRGSLEVDYSTSDETSGTSTVTHDNGLQERTTWTRAMPGDSAEIELVEYRTCGDCEWEEIWPVRTVDWRGNALAASGEPPNSDSGPNPSGDAVETRTPGGLAESASDALSDSMQAGPSMSARAADEAAFERYAQELFDRLAPVPDSFDWASPDFRQEPAGVEGDANAGAWPKTAVLRVDHQGNAYDLHIGGLSLKALREKAAQGQLPDCESGNCVFTDTWMEERLSKLDSIGIDEANVQDLLLMDSLMRGLARKSTIEAKRRPPVSALICSDVRTCEQLQNAHVMAALSACAYSDTWRCSHIATPVDPAAAGLDASLFINERSGLHAQLVQMNDTGEYVLVFRGTEFEASWAGLRDFRTDLSQFATINDAQYQGAADLSVHVQAVLAAQLSVDSFHVTGHSLGGGLATQAALAAGQHATVFNAAALRPGVARANGTDLAAAEQLVSSYIVDEELVDVLQSAGYEQVNTRGDTELVACDFCGHSAPGQRIDLPVPANRPYGWWLSPVESLGLHGTDSVLASLGDVLRVSCGSDVTAPKA